MTEAGAAHPLLRFDDFHVRFPRGPAVRGIDLSLSKGEALGIVGESGSGKSVTWLAALGLLGPAAQITGSVRFDDQDLRTMPAGRLARLRGGRIALISQDPMSALNPVQRVGRQIAEVLRLHRGLSKTEARRETIRLFDQVGIPDARNRVDLFPHELSGGQNQRVMIAMALAGQPDLLVADEPTTALDVTIQAQILTLLDDLRRDLGMALVLISHDLAVVGELCDRISVFYAGRIVESAPMGRLLRAPAHPYTAGLIAAAPRLGRGRGTLTPIPGQVPDPWNMPKGCAFAPRCLHVRADCTHAQPDFAPVAGHRSHLSACVLSTPAQTLTPEQTDALT
ncbi:ABC transporter ATP-binding protein [Pseudooceanicola sp. CBS1P-1]|uniref:ATP-binding cassette domain-containing protein n=2 Tax=Pseudooceanicola albus TaxID=2692189 RepID=A0A6L7FYR2_9RHOB|nr:ABC transporter ATP-binding protein [Pseudooceanicola endophyticus]MBT9382333.1 ABC transporter ATP-binding protein [Pseudooceanicola endophyticus]MXN16875.1 ATP-binding cassette domain-containing protein [Pseudooceanicola albus]